MTHLFKHLIVACVATLSNPDSSRGMKGLRGVFLKEFNVKHVIAQHGSVTCLLPVGSDGKNCCRSALVERTAAVRFKWKEVAVVGLRWKER